MIRRPRVPIVAGKAAPLDEHRVIDELGGIAYATAALRIVAWWRLDAARRAASVGS